MKLPIIYVTLRRNRQITIPSPVTERLGISDKEKIIMRIAILGYQKKGQTTVAVSPSTLDFCSDVIVEEILGTPSSFENKEVKE